MAKSSTPPDPLGARMPRVIATMAATVAGLTILAIAAIFVLRAAGVQQAAFRSGALQLVAVLPLPGIALSLVLIIVLIAMAAVGKARSSRR